MSAPTEDRGQVSHPVLGDLAQWYETFLAYAAAAPAGNPHFPVPHAVHVPFDAERLRAGLSWFEKTHGQLVGPELLPDLATMRQALSDWKHAGGRVTDGENGVHRHPHLHPANGVKLSGGGLAGSVELDSGGIETRDQGSPCHNFWHWLNGTS